LSLFFNSFADFSISPLKVAFSIIGFVLFSKFFNLFSISAAFGFFLSSSIKSNKSDISDFNNFLSELVNVDSGSSESFNLSVNLFATSSAFFLTSIFFI